MGTGNDAIRQRESSVTETKPKRENSAATIGKARIADVWSAKRRIVQSQLRRPRNTSVNWEMVWHKRDGDMRSIHDQIVRIRRLILGSILNTEMYREMGRNPYAPSENLYHATQSMNTWVPTEDSIPELAHLREKRPLPCFQTVLTSYSASFPCQSMDQ